jgi:hypothetical protein
MTTDREKRPGTRFQCPECGKLTSGRLPRDGRHVGDGTVRYPRRHKVDGKPCPGNIMEAVWVDIKAKRPPKAAPPR